MSSDSLKSYEDLHRRAIEDREAFWSEAAKGLSWWQTFDRVLDDSRPPFYRWFPRGGLNICYNAIDRHLMAGRGGQAAIIYDSPVTGTVTKITYHDLAAQVARFAGG